MRAILSKVAAVSLIAGAGLLVTACGGGETPATVNNTEVEVPLENTGASDEMVTNIDGATGNGAVVENVTDNATVGNEM